MKSIIIPTHNHCADLLKPCVDAILKNTNMDDVELVIVANGCTDDTRGYLETIATNDHIRSLWFDEAMGYIRATNEGIKASRGEIVVLMNNDAFLLDWQAKGAWLDRLTDPFNDPWVGITGPVKFHDPTIKRDVIMFYCAAIKRELFDKIGLLDERYHPGGLEDLQFCVDAENLGYKLVAVAQSRYVNGSAVTDYPMYHVGHATFCDAEHIEKRDEIIKRNMQILIEHCNRPGVKNVLVQLVTRPLRGDNPGVNPKNYPHREELLGALRGAGHRVTEIDKPISLAESKKLVAEADVIICIDSYLQHLCWAMDRVAIVLWGQSDPRIFGHSCHINLLKDRKYLREKQHWLWEQAVRNDEAFVTPDAVLKEIEKIGSHAI